MINHTEGEFESAVMEIGAFQEETLRDSGDAKPLYRGTARQSTPVATNIAVKCVNVINNSLLHHSALETASSHECTFLWRDGVGDQGAERRNS